MTPPRLALAHTPTPILRAPARLVSQLSLDPSRIELWIKRDDVTGGPEAGNKVRKLEFLLAEARAKGATVLVTCGGVQSNHARATAVLGATLGMRAVLLLRTTSADLDPQSLPLTGNVFLDRMVGAEIRLITPHQYRERAERMAAVAEELRAAGEVPYVIAEGGSSGLGCFGYVRAMEEIGRQLELGMGGGRPFDVIVHACGSGGTAAGVALGAASAGVASEVRPMAVCDDAAYFEATVARLVDEARALDPRLGPPVPVRVDDRAKGPAYGIATESQKRMLVEVARASGLLLDPVYTGKAFYGLVQAARRGELDGARVLFLHTGGLPGLMAQGAELADAIRGTKG
jgi:D-cysteine desulfhydrase